jgi:two-component system, NarL family, sensor histidine kinase DegS
MTLNEMVKVYDLIRVWPRRPKILLSNPHLWILAIILIALTIIYTWDIGLNNPRWDWFTDLTVFEFNHSMHGILFCIPIIYAAYLFWWRGALITWIWSVGITLPRIIYFKHDPVSLIENLFYLLIPVLLVIYFAVERNWREKERRALAERETERKSYTSQVLKAHEDERRRIAQELHDDPTQTLLVIANRAQALVSDGFGSQELEKKAELEWIRDTTVAVSEDLKRICLDLRPSVLDDVGLIAALRWVIEGFNRTSSIYATLEIQGVERKLSPEREVTLFRIAQEALNNVRRHSQASLATVIVLFKSDNIKITIQDNGRGFLLEKIKSELTINGKLGLLGMQERTQLLNGILVVHSEPSTGTLISVEVNTN